MGSSGSGESGREAEAVLMVVSTNPAAVQKHLASLESVAGMALSPARDIETVDTYYDTPGRTLSEKKMALRLRRLPDSTIIGLKGEEEWTENGVLRLELEERWSSNALADVLHELGFRNVKLTWPGMAIGGAEPAEVLAAMGLEAIQVRRLTRTARDVLGSGGDPVAELALDTVTQEIAGAPVVYREVEVEAADASEAGIIATVIEALLEGSRGELVRWSHNKLATGMALERLASTGGPAGLVGTDGELTPAGVEALARELARG